MGLALNRLNEERKNWRKDHPAGFYARPSLEKNRTQNMFLWECGVPGGPGTVWEGGVYRLELVFTAEYPMVPPECYFSPPLFHPNVYIDGLVCLSILGKDWKASLTLKQILLGIQKLLGEPNTRSPANIEAHELFTKNKSAYFAEARKAAEGSKQGGCI
ncbi:MAG: ubiquitin conjugating enzyme E2 [Amphiamblys sp. WSBS2006]|nr:MAG: ubiquitin conjugating enzyme E2 [Amphiamblys sp. WSBS2006]